MSATAFQRIRREQAKKLDESQSQEEKKESPKKKSKK